MNNITKIIIGTLVMLIGVWGGAFLMSLFPYPSSYNFAAFTASLGIFTVGCLLVIFAVTDYLNTGRL